MARVNVYLPDELAVDAGSEWLAQAEALPSLDIAHDEALSALDAAREELSGLGRG